MQDAVVVGAGIAGLSAAWALRDHDVVVLEAGPRIGGRIRSEQRGHYWINFGAHVFGGPDTATGRLMAEAGVASEPVPGVLTAVSMQRRLVASGPVASYPFRLPLSFSDRVAAIRSGIKLRRAVARYDRAARPRKGEHHNVRRDRMLAFLGDETFSSFIGHLPAGVEALYRPTITRSSGELDELAAGHGVDFHLVWRKGEGLSRNVLGGSSKFTHALARPLGGRLLTDAPVQEVTQHKDRVVVRFRRGDRDDEIRSARRRARDSGVRHGDDRPGAARGDALGARVIPDRPYVVVAFLTGEPEATRWDGLYAIATPGRAFNMIFNLANVVRGPGARRPGEPDALLRRSTSRGAPPEADRRGDRRTVSHGPRRGVPGSPLDGGRGDRATLAACASLSVPGRYRIQPALDRPLGRIALAGDYLGNLYTETAIQTGLAAAEHVLATLGFAGE